MANPIRVVLQDNVDKLGASGDVVRVRPGYARNFLIPRGLAVPATSGNLTRVEELKRLAGVRADKARAEAQELAKQLEAASVKITRAVGEEKKMYGSVTARDIEEAYSAQGIKLDRRKIQLAQPIRELGIASVPIKLHPSVTATLRVEVTKKT
jgi:large subunit ribosomal protein L9